MTSVMPARLWWLIGGSALMLIGAFGPWAQAFIVSVSGVDGTDGWIVVALAVVAGMCAYGYAKADKQGNRTALMILAVLAGVAGLAVFGMSVLCPVMSGMGGRTVSSYRVRCPGVHRSPLMS